MFAIYLLYMYHYFYRTSECVVALQNYVLSCQQSDVRLEVISTSAFHNAHIFFSDLLWSNVTNVSRSSSAEDQWVWG